MLEPASRCSLIASTASIRWVRAICEWSTELTDPWHWHYMFLRGLDYLRLTPPIGDKRADDAIELLGAAEAEPPLAAAEADPGTPLS